MREGDRRGNALTQRDEHFVVGMLCRDEAVVYEKVAVRPASVTNGDLFACFEIRHGEALDRVAADVVSRAQLRECTDVARRI